MNRYKLNRAINEVFSSISKEELEQEILIEQWKGRDEVSAFINLIMNKYKEYKRLHNHTQIDVDLDSLPQEENPYQDLLSEDIEIPIEYRYLLTLVYDNGITKAAEILNSNKVQLWRVLNRIREVL